ncbi:MAG: flippase-like domain-containing protein [Candidatus Brocadia sp.]|uniref:Integral membrane protein n=1 Tax=Candidatus Brocadia fulgida TaxID=380242 RepID=A0A0M2V0S4_9BACT|nr:MAG: hypothetical protein BROFUL_00961 [Candidatus Brocadia fulgida]UJS21639.1 MAG: flippase-like domain-containing protein [Candidatus Brocadia sp.]
MAFRPITIKKGLKIFIGLTVLAICLLLVFTSDIKTLQTLKLIDHRFLLLSLTLICLSWFFDVLRFRVLTKIAGTKTPFLYGTKALLSYTFVSNITPSSAGGETVLIYLLNQSGVALGKATAIIFLRTIITMIFFAIGGLLTIYFYYDLLSNASLKILFHYVAIFLAITVIVIIYLLFAPLSARKGLNFLFLYFEKITFFKKNFSWLRHRLFRVVNDFKSSLKEVVQEERWRLLLVIFYTVLMIAAQFLVAPLLLAGLGCKVNVMNTVRIQFVLNFLLYYMPTPGGSGASEGVGYALFSPLVPSSTIGVFLVLWKFLTMYVWTVIGGIIIAKTIGMKHLEELSKNRETFHQNEKKN